MDRVDKAEFIVILFMDMGIFYIYSVTGQPISIEITGWQFHNGRYKLIFSVIEIRKMS